MKTTPRRKLILDTFKAMEKVTNQPVSLTDVATECGMSPSTAHEHAMELFDAGMLQRTRFGGSKKRPYFKYHAAKRCPTCGKRT